MRGRKAKPAESLQGARAGSGSANRTRSTDRVRLRSRTRAARARRHDDSRDGSRPRTRSRPRHHETRERRSPWLRLESILEARARGGDGSGVVFANDDSDPGLAGSKRLRRLTDRSKP